MFSEEKNESFVCLTELWTGFLRRGPLNVTACRREGNKDAGFKDSKTSCWRSKRKQKGEGCTSLDTRREYSVEGKTREAI